MRTNCCQLVPLQIIERVVTVVSERYWNLRLAPIAANRCCQHCYELYITVLLLITIFFFHNNADDTDLFLRCCSGVCKSVGTSQVT